MPLRRLVVLLAWLLTGLVAVPYAGAQDAAAWAWKTLHEQDGLAIRYIFYREADTRNDGVVLLLDNTNPHAVDYRFKVVFRGDASEVVEVVSGRLAAGERRTGDAEGLFWIPFENGDAVAELGLRGLRVEAVPGLR